jgi:putative transposase
MLRTYKYRIYPDKRTEQNLMGTLEVCRWTYNNVLALRKDSYEQDGKSVSKFDCNKAIKIWKKQEGYESLNNVHSQVLQNVSDRVDKAYSAFFRRVKMGETPGFPRFRGFGWYDSFTFPQTGFELFQDEDQKVYLSLSKIGYVRVVYHRKIEGDIKTCTIRKTPTGKWYATFSCEVPDVRKKEIIENPVGVDCGLYSFITLSNGQKVDIQKFFRTAEDRIAQVQRRMSLCTKGTPERREMKKRVALAYEKVSHQRENFAHQISKRLVENYDYIIFEDLSIDRMIKNHRLAKSIQDVAWNQLVQYTQYKAENAGTWVELVDPAYTSQMCSDCGNVRKKSLSERVHVCEECGLEMDRDENAAINIMRLGTQSLEAPML